MSLVSFLAHLTNQFGMNCVQNVIVNRSPSLVGFDHLLDVLGHRSQYTQFRKVTINPHEQEKTQLALSQECFCLRFATLDRSYWTNR